MPHDPLPAQIRSLFWDLDPRELRWDRDQEQIIGRVLASGSWDSVTWLRKRAGDDAVREWIERHQGRGLSPRQLRFWELILDLPHRRVDEWLRSERRQVWDRRARR
jgi:hypothetical protein